MGGLNVKRIARAVVVALAALLILSSLVYSAIHARLDVFVFTIGEIVVVVGVVQGVTRAGRSLRRARR